MSNSFRARLAVAASFALLLGLIQVHAQSVPKAQPGWIADPKSGCKVWNPQPEPNESITWSGPCKDGIANGKGTLQWIEEGKPGSRYDGEMKGGKPNGHGIEVHANGNRYEGEFKDYQYNGHGIWTGAKGGRMEGQFVGGKFTGSGSITYDNGNSYQGGFKDGKRSGHGVFVIAKGGRMDGQWADDKFTGTGSIKYDNGDSYAGGFKDGKRQGHGVFTWSSNGARYEGDFMDDHLTGRGVETWPTGARYEGEFVDGLPNGIGSSQFPNGEVDNGIWANGCFSDGNRRAWIIPIGETKAGHCPSLVRWAAVAAGLWRDGNGTAHAATGFAVRSTESDANSAAVESCQNIGQNCSAIRSWSSGCGYITTGNTQGRVRWGSGATAQSAIDQCQDGGYSCKQPIGGCID